MKTFRLLNISTFTIVKGNSYIMLTIDDIKYVSFRKSNMRGYRPEDVDVFIDDVQQTVEKLIQEKDELEKKLSILANQVKKYRDDEDYLKETLLNAKRLSDASLKETKQKCDEMLAKAKKDADGILNNANVEADKIITRAKDDLESKRSELYETKKEAINFRTKLLKMYKEHLKLIDALPNTDSIKKTENIKLDQETDKQHSFDNNSFAGSIEKVNREVSKLLEKKGSEILDKNEQTSKDVLNVQKENDKRYNNLKFGENYNLDADNEVESPTNLLKRKK